jgi:hypothetical protein
MDISLDNETCLQNIIKIIEGVNIINIHFFEILIVEQNCIMNPGRTQEQILKTRRVWGWILSCAITLSFYWRLHYELGFYYWDFTSTYTFNFKNLNENVHRQVTHSTSFDCIIILGWRVFSVYFQWWELESLAPR